MNVIELCYEKNLRWHEKLKVQIRTGLRIWTGQLLWVIVHVSVCHGVYWNCSSRPCLVASTMLYWIRWAEPPTDGQNPNHFSHTLETM